RHTRSDRDWSSDVCSSDLLCQGTASSLSKTSSLVAIACPARASPCFDWENSDFSPEVQQVVSHENQDAQRDQPRVRLDKPCLHRSEERRVGKEGRSRGGRE